MERLHPLNQKKFANIMHVSPSVFTEDDFYLNPADLVNYLEQQKKEQQEEENRLKAIERRKIFFASQGRGSSMLSFGGGRSSVFGNEETGDEFNILNTGDNPHTNTDEDADRKKSLAVMPGMSAAARRRKSKKMIVKKEESK
jgi:hypothetical protein